MKLQKHKAEIMPITPEELIGYINSISTGTKKGTYYNMPDEQRAALDEKIGKMVAVFRPFALLMTLTPITNDAKIATWIKLFSTTPQLPQGLTERDIRKWESTIIRQALEWMSPNQVFDFFCYMSGYRHEKMKGKTVLKRTKKALGGKFIKGIIKDYLKSHLSSIDLWSVKYHKDIKRIARHIHLSPKDIPEIKFVFGGEPIGVIQQSTKICRQASKGNIPSALWRLPMENARGMALGKFGLTNEEFERQFAQLGEKTTKEARLSHRRTIEAGGESSFNPNRAKLFDLYVHLGAQKTLPINAREWIDKAGEREAKKIRLNFKNTAVIVDTSPSMFGTSQTKRHPIFTAMTIAKIIEKRSQKFAIYYTTKQKKSVIIPKLHGSTSYAQAIISAIKAGYTQIIILGDGYENAPEGLTHKVVSAFKEKIDTEDRVTFIHLNPVQAAEAGSGVREISSLIPSAGIKQVSALPSAIFVALAKSHPIAALSTYYQELLTLQDKKAKALMPYAFKMLQTFY